MSNLSVHSFVKIKQETLHSKKDKTDRLFPTIVKEPKINKL